MNLAGITWYRLAGEIGQQVGVSVEITGTYEAREKGIGITGGANAGVFIQENIINAINRGVASFRDPTTKEPMNKNDE